MCQPVTSARSGAAGEDPLAGELLLEEEARELEVLVERLRRGGRVVAFAGGEEAAVELTMAHLRLVLGGEERRAEALRAIPGRPDQRDEPRRLRGFVEREVKIGVGAHVLTHVLLASQLVEAVELRLRGDRVCLGE